MQGQYQAPCWRGIRRSKGADCFASAVLLDIVKNADTPLPNCFAFCRLEFVGPILEFAGMIDAKLIVVEGKSNKQDIPLTPPMVIGRDRDADLRIAHPTVSRRHCHILEVNGQLVVRDNDSLNGTFVNSQRIKEAALLPGYRLAVGPLTFIATYTLAEGAVPLADSTLNVSETGSINGLPARHAHEIPPDSGSFVMHPTAAQAAPHTASEAAAITSGNIPAQQIVAQGQEAAQTAKWRSDGDDARTVRAAPKKGTSEQVSGKESSKDKKQPSASNSPPEANQVVDDELDRFLRGLS